MKTRPLFVRLQGSGEERAGRRARHELGNCLDIAFEGESITALVLASAKLTVEDVGGHEHDVKGGARLHRCRVEGLQNDQGRFRVNERVRRHKPERNMDAQTRSTRRVVGRRCIQHSSLGSARQDWSTTSAREGRSADLPMKYVIETSDLPANGEIRSFFSLEKHRGDGEGTYEYVP